MFRASNHDRPLENPVGIISLPIKTGIAVAVSVPSLRGPQELRLQAVLLRKICCRLLVVDGRRQITLAGHDTGCLPICVV